MKRRFSQLQDEPMLRIQLADEAPDKPPLEACSLLLRASCSCARGLPLDSSSWDLSSLLIDGQPVSRGTVTAWLNVVYTLLDNKPFEEGVPAAAASATQLYQLLALADAVGSSQGVLNACLAGLEELCFKVKVGEQEVQMKAGEITVCSMVASLMRTHMMTPVIGALPTGTAYLAMPQPDGTCVLSVPAARQVAVMADAQQFLPAMRELAAQLEPLLYLAYHLQLVPLQEVLHGFIRQNTCAANSALVGHMEALLSPRVVQASVDSSVAKRALLQLLVTEQRPLGPITPEGLLLPAGGPESSVVKFRAALAHLLPCSTSREVQDMQLDICKSQLVVGSIPYTVQLSVGPMLSVPGQVQQVLREPAVGQPPAPPTPTD
jgi:hypothetical protein